MGAYLEHIGLITYRSMAVCQCNAMVIWTLTSRWRPFRLASNLGFLASIPVNEILRLPVQHIPCHSLVSEIPLLGWHIINLSLTVLICFPILWGLDWLTVCDWYCPVVGAARKWLAHYRLIGQEWQQSHPGAQLPTRSLNYLTQAGQTLLWKDFVGFSNVLSLDRCGEYEDTNLWAQ